MQNLSLQSPQNSALTKMSALNKQDSTANSAANADAGQAFKDVLSNQVRSQQSETQQLNQTKTQSAQGITKATPPKQTQNVGTKPAEQIKDKNAADDSKTPAVQDSAGLTLEDLDAAKKIKILAENAELDSSKVDAPSPQPLPTDAVLAALSIPVPSTIVPVEATHGVLAKDHKLAVDASSSASVADALEPDAAQKTGLSLKDQPDLAKSAAATTKADLSDWVESVLPNQAKQTEASLAGTKLGAAALQELTAKSAINNVVPNIVTSTALNPLNAMQAASSNIINVSPGKTGWDQAIGQKVAWMVGAGEQSATLTLNPPDLGPLQVVIHVHNDQADTTFISDNSDVRRALQDGLSNLKDMLSQSGINLGQANINSSQQEQQARQSSRESNSGNQNSFTTTETDTKPTLVTRVSNGLVDIFA
ncbi:MAG: flagellar hook-length control protein FliK [Methylophilaceae bacterium]